jgi:hypothetical protein
MEDIDQCWRKSSYSGNGGECVEVGTPADHDGVAVRDTKDQQGLVLRFEWDAWRQFVGEIKDLTPITSGPAPGANPRDSLVDPVDKVSVVPIGWCTQ